MSFFLFFSFFNLEFRKIHAWLFGLEWFGFLWTAWSGLRSKLEFFFFLSIPGSDTASSSSPPPRLSSPLPIKVYSEGFQNILFIQPPRCYQWYFPHFHLNILSHSFCLHCWFLLALSTSVWDSKSYIYMLLCNKVPHLKHCLSIV